MAQMPVFNDFTAQQGEIARRRKMAEALQVQSLQPIEQTTAGGMVVPISPVQGLAKMLQAYVGAKGLQNAAAQEQSLAGQRSQVLAQALGAMPQARQEQNTTMAAPLTANDDEGNVNPQVAMTSTVTKKPTPQEYAAWLSGLSNIGSDAVQIGSSLMTMQNKQAEPFTLKAGEVRYGADNRPVASAPFRPEPPKLPTPKAPGSLRERISGDKTIQEELQLDGTWREVGTGPRFAKSVPSTVVTGGGMGKPPVGYRFKSDGSLEPIPGGPAANSSADVKTVQQLGKAFETANLPQMISVLEKAEGAVSDPSVLAWVNGPKSAIPDVMSPKAAVDARQAVQKLFNITLKDRSGAAVTNQELERLRKEFGQGVFKTPEQLTEAISQARNIIQNHFMGIAAGYGKNALERYNQNLSEIGGKVFLGANREPGVSPGASGSFNLPSPADIQAELAKRGGNGR